MLKKSWGTTNLGSRTPELLALSKKKIAALMSFFPMDRCLELVKLSVLAEIEEFSAGDDPVILPDFDEHEQARARDDLGNLAIPDEEKREIQVLLLFAGKRASGFHQLTTKQKTEFFDNVVYITSQEIVTSWLTLLNEVQPEAWDKPLRLDSALLPPPEMMIRGGISWEDELEDVLSLNAAQIRELMALYAKKLIPVFNLMIANNPNGFELFEDVFICMDKDGFYLLPEAED